MRTREVIEKVGLKTTKTDEIILEVLLDIRDLLAKIDKKTIK